MDLKDFIVETISSIVEASKELSEKYGPAGAVVNPPASSQKPDDPTFAVDSRFYSNRRVQNIEFDVAVTTADSTTGGGKAGLKIWVAEGGVEGAHARSNERISRIKFAVPLSLPASPEEKDNLTRRKNYNSTSTLGP